MFSVPTVVLADRRYVACFQTFSCLEKRRNEGLRGVIFMQKTRVMTCL